MVQRQALFLSFLLMAMHHVWASQISCQLEIQLDDHPEQVAFELRAASAPSQVMAETHYGDYRSSQAHETVREDLMLQADESYHLIMLDDGEDGIQGGGFRLSCKFGAYDKILLQGDGDFEGGKVSSFQVHPPLSQRAVQASQPEHSRRLRSTARAP